MGMLYTSEELAQLRPHLEDLFLHLDFDHDGRVDSDALLFALHTNGCVYDSRKELIMKILDETEPSGLYDKSTFIDILLCELASRTSEEETERMFKLFMHYTGEGEEDHIIMAPLEDDDAITVKDLQRLVGVLGKSMDSEELEDMIKECSVSGAKVDLNDWRSLVTHKTDQQGERQKVKSAVEPKAKRKR